MVMADVENFERKKKRYRGYKKGGVKRRFHNRKMEEEDKR
jgi:hypothetical protein